MQEDLNKTTQKHNLILENRNKLSLSAVLEVESFDENLIIAITPLGSLSIKGDNLHISKLDLDVGEVIVDGNIYSMLYSDDVDDSKGFLSKLFK